MPEWAKKKKEDTMLLFNFIILESECLALHSKSFLFDLNSKKKERNRNKNKVGLTS